MEENKIRDHVLDMLGDIENDIIDAGRMLQSRAVMFKQDVEAMKNIEKSLTEILKAQKKLKS